MKRTVLALVLCMAVLLCACDDRLTVEDMLTAPALTPDQSAIIHVMENYSEERVVLKYPTSGDRRYPIQFIDLDNDGEVEAVVFFSIPSEGLYAQMAVLEKTEGAWEIAAVTDGKGTDIRTVRVMNYDASTERVLLVEWFTANRRGEDVAAYRYTGGELVSNFEDASTSLRVFDFDNDGYEEFCYVSNGALDRMVLKYVDTSEGAFTVVSEIVLSAGMIDCIDITGGRTEDGTHAVFVDENINDEYQITEVFVVGEAGLSAIELEDYDIAEVSRRPITALTCRRFFGSSTIYIPSAEVPFEGILQRDAYTFWYAIDGDQLTYIHTTYIDTEYNIALCLPDYWLSRVVTGRPENEQRMITVYDTEQEYSILFVKILTVGESGATYINDGYELVAQSGSFRYYIKGYCSQEDLAFIISNFATL